MAQTRNRKSIAAEFQSNARSSREKQEALAVRHVAVDDFIQCWRSKTVGSAHSRTFRKSVYICIAQPSFQGLEILAIPVRFNITGWHVIGSKSEWY